MRRLLISALTRATVAPAVETLELRLYFEATHAAQLLGLLRGMALGDEPRYQRLGAMCERASRRATRRMIAYAEFCEARRVRIDDLSRPRIVARPTPAAAPSVAGGAPSEQLDAERRAA